MSRVPLGNAFAGTKTLGQNLGQMPAIVHDFVFEIPELLEPGNARMARVMNRIVKESIKEEMIKHHKSRIPHHFDPFKQKKYRYKKRDPQTIERKRRQRGRAADLVQTGRTKRDIKSRIDIRISGAAGKGNVVAKGRMFMKRGMRPSKGSDDVSIDQMADEIRVITRQEAGDILVGYSERIIKKLDASLTPRVRRRVKSQLQSLGIR